MSVYILPILIVFLFIYSFFKKVNTYKSFVDGAKGAFSLCLDIFPYIVAILMAVALFRVSGLASFLTKIFINKFYNCRCNTIGYSGKYFNIFHNNNSVLTLFVNTIIKKEIFFQIPLKNYWFYMQGVTRITSVTLVIQMYSNTI